VKLVTRRSILLAIAVSTILTLPVAYYWPFQEPYYPLNTDWNGCSQIVSSTTNSTIIWSYNTPLQRNGTLLAIIGPSVGFSRSESSQIHTFLQSGGTVLLADDFGTGNNLLKDLNVTMRFSPTGIAALYFYSKNPSFPIVTDFTSNPVTRNLTAIITERPSYIENSTGARILAMTSPFSFIDFNGNGEPSTNETLRPYPIIVEESVGKGLLILVSDPGVFTNQLVPLYGNRDLFLNILNVAGGHLVYDAYHLESAPLTAWRADLRQEIGSIESSQGSLYIQAILVASIVVAVLAVQLAKLPKKHVKGLQ
jgi:Domain of unknown function (DUF4350)